MARPPQMPLCGGAGRPRSRRATHGRPLVRRRVGQRTSLPGSRDWSPGYEPGEHLALVKQCLAQPANLAAALGYYRAAGGSGSAPGTAARYAAQQQAVGRQAPQPTLYLHGARDGCIGVGLARGAERLLAPSSRMVVIGDAGHFLHLERPDEVNDQILSWVSYA